MYTETNKFFIGYKDEEGTYHREFEYREMDGYDEEAISKPKIKDNGSVVERVILSRCIVRIGTINKDSVKPKEWEEIIQSLTIYDQDYAFMQIRALSLGDEFTVTHKCANPDCSNKIKTTFTLDEFEIIPYSGEERIQFDLPRGVYDKEGNKHNVGFMRYPTGLDREVLGKTARNNFGLASTLLLARLIDSIGEVKVYDEVIRKMSIKDRQYLLDLVDENKFGYDLDNLPSIECPQCGEVFEVTLNSADFL